MRLFLGAGELSFQQSRVQRLQFGRGRRRAVRAGGVNQGRQALFVFQSNQDADLPHRFQRRVNFAEAGNEEVADQAIEGIGVG